MSVVIQSLLAEFVIVVAGVLVAQFVSNRWMKWSRRLERPASLDAAPSVMLLNFGHPLTADQRLEIQNRINTIRIQEREIQVQFDPLLPFAEQCRALLASIDLTPQQWQNQPILINPPTLNVIAATLLAELHGRMGYFPPVLRLRLREGSLPPQFEVAEIIDLQALRQAARQAR
jgi:hypothetical protein